MQRQVRTVQRLDSINGVILSLMVSLDGVSKRRFTEFDTTMYICDIVSL